MRNTFYFPIQSEMWFIQVDLEIIIPTEVSQTEKDKYHRASFICRILKKKKKKDTNELIYKTEIDPQAQKQTHRKQAYDYRKCKEEV